MGLSANDHDYIRHFDCATGVMDTFQLDYSILNRAPQEVTTSLLLPRTSLPSKSTSPNCVPRNSR